MQSHRNLPDRITMATTPRTKQQHPIVGSTDTSVSNEVTTAVPTLKVMRLQKPELDTTKAGTLNTSGCLLGSSLCLPDSFGVIHVGETFTAYLGALNVSKRLPVTNLTVTAQLQTPSQRWHMASNTLDECNAKGGCELLPGKGIDSIVSHALEEAGQHILRVEVGYGGQGGTMKSLRKFYRFQVSNPLVISELTYRTGDSSCFVSISLQNNGHESKGGLTVSSAEFEAPPGLVAEKVVDHTAKNEKQKGQTGSNKLAKGMDLYDDCGRLEPGDSKRYIFRLSISDEKSTSGLLIRGIAAGDELGKAVFTWRKACGEMGRMASSAIVCPVLHPVLDPNNPGAMMEGNGSDFVVHVKGSSLSVDVATHAGTRTSKNPHERDALDLILPLTVEPLNPPNQMHVGIPIDIAFLVVNHSQQFITPQIQFRLEHMKGIAVCGPSVKNVEEISGNGGSTTILMRFIALSTGLAQLTGCCIVNLGTGQVISQPPMMNILVVEE
mmetsp:Transcript_25255/g.69627  ORF Transcript_25255/g.69627 Transcript_25255/m.69627 type:complete len:495 (+) Transcript_25255:109-1593(+)